MTQEDRELLLKDLSSRLPHGVKISVDNRIETLQGINVSDNVVEYGSFLSSDIEEVKPYLFPLSSITEEEKEEYCQLQQRIIYNSKGVVNEDVTKYTNWCYKKHLDIIVEDNGIGMTKEELEKVTEMFYTTKPTGSGLGVALSNEIIKAHNGELIYTSEKNKGTKVTIRLPYNG